MRLILGDCLDVMRGMPENSVDAIITDPPYGTTDNHWDIFESDEIYYDFIISVFRESLRVLKESRNFLFFHNYMPHISELMARIKKELPLLFRSFITWNKPNYHNQSWQVNSSDNNLRSWFNTSEYILHYEYYPFAMPSTGLEMIYSSPECFKSIKEYFRLEKERIKKDKGFTNSQFDNWINEVTQTSSVASRHYFSDSQWILPTAERYAMMQATGYFQRPYEPLRQEYESLRQEYESLRQEYESLRPPFNKFIGENYNNVWNIPTSGNPNHPTEKPLNLMMKLIRTHTNEGNIILDPFMGSGTTGLACRKTNRDFIGIEINHDYFKIAQARIDAAMSTPVQEELFN